MCPDLHSVTSDKSANPVATSTTGTSYADDTFDLKKSASYHVSIELGPRSLAFCILDTLSNQYVALHQEEVVNDGMGNASSQLLSLLQTHEYLNAKFKSSSVLLASEKFTTVPNAIFDPAKAGAFLDFNIDGVDSSKRDVEILSDKMEGIDAHNIYALSREILDKIKKSLPGVSIIHHTTSLITTLMGLYKNQNQEICFLHVQKGLFTIIVIKGNDLKLCNNFIYNTKEDFAYYTLFVFEQLKINPELVDTVLLGEIDKNTEDL